MPEERNKIIKEDRSGPAGLVKSVWNVDNIDAKTDLTDEQIKAVNILKTTGLIFGSPLLIHHTEHFMTLQKSRNRQSMGEFVAALRSLKEDAVEKMKSFQLFG